MPDGSSLPRSHRTLRSAAELVAAGLLPPGEREAAEAVAARYAVAVTPAVRRLMDPADPADPIARQYLPDAAELRTAPGEVADPTADAPFSPVKGVVHRYPDRALLKPLLACPVYCRFCFRREAVGPGGGTLGEAELEAALDWFARTPAVREAILTGGDPLMLSPRRLSRIVERLSAMPHIEIIRLHSRVPVADPERVTPALLRALDTDRALFLCVHANHAREFSTEARAALAHLHRGGRGGPARAERAAARREQQRGGAGSAVPRHARGAGEALLPAPARPRARHRALRGAHRRRARPVARVARPRHRPGLADLRARRAGRRREGADRSRIRPVRGRRMAVDAPLRQEEHPESA